MESLKHKVYFVKIKFCPASVLVRFFLSIGHNRLLGSCFPLLKSINFYFAILERIQGQKETRVLGFSWFGRRAKP